MIFLYFIYPWKSSSCWVMSEVIELMFSAWINSSLFTRLTLNKRKCSSSQSFLWVNDSFDLEEPCFVVRNLEKWWFLWYWFPLILPDELSAGMVTIYYYFVNCIFYELAPPGRDVKCEMVKVSETWLQGSVINIGLETH